MNNRSSRNRKRNERIVPLGYVPLSALADKHGYSQDHVGWLARTGRVDACQVGNRRQWYVREASLKKYKNEIETSIAHGYIPLRMAARQYGYAKDYIGTLARSGTIDAQQDARGRWFVREASLKTYHGEASQRRIVNDPRPPIARVASYSVQPIQPVTVLSAVPVYQPGEQTDLPPRRRWHSAFAYAVGVILLLLSGFALRNEARNLVRIVKQSLDAAQSIATRTPDMVPPPPYIAPPFPSPSPITPQPIPSLVFITNAPTRSQLLLAVEDYFAQGLPFRLFWLLKGPKGDTGPAGPRGLTTHSTSTGGGIPSDLSLETLTVAGHTLLANYASISPKLEIFNATGTASLELFANNDEQKRFVIQSDGAADRLDFLNGTTKLLSITSSGNVGIGTTNPGALLSFGGNVAAQTILLNENEFAGSSRYGFGIQPFELRQFYPSSAPHHFSIGTISTSDGTTFNEKVRVDSAGNFGIGSTGPEQKLEVAGNILASTSGNIDLILHTTSETGANQGLFTLRSAGASERLDILNNTTVLMTIASSGNVGIGTTNPVRPLHVLDVTVTNSPVARFEYSGGTGAIEIIGNDISGGAIYFGDSQDQDIGRIIYSNDTNAFGLYTNNSEKLTITSDGNVGIGTTTPTAKLQVVGNASVSTNFEASGYASVSALFGAGLTDCDGTVGNMALNWNISTGTFSCTTDDIGGGGGALIEVRESSVGNGTNVSSLSFNAGGFDISFSGTEAIIKLDYLNGPASLSQNEIVTGNWTFTGQTTLGNASISGNFDPAIDNTYQLGNTAYRWKSIFLGPGSLHISSTTGTSGAGANYTDGILQFTSGSSLSLGTQAVGSGLAGSLELRTANTARLFVSSGGNVGIGTIAPTSLLHTSEIEINKAADYSSVYHFFESNTNSPQAFIHSALEAYARHYGGQALTTLIGVNARVSDDWGSVTNARAFNAFVSENLNFQTITNAVGFYAQNFTKVANSTITNSYGVYVEPQTGATNNYGAYFGSNVGIGATSPEQKLEVAGNILASASGNIDLILHTTSETGANQGLFTLRSAGASERLDIFNNTTALMTIASLGNVGIGTTNPNGLQIELAVSETARGTDNVRLGTSVGTPRIIFEDASSAVQWELDNSAGQFRIYQPGTVKMVIESSGAVGINDISPDAKLDVAGSGIFDNELIVADALQVGGATSVSYNRFGTSAATSGLITGNSDALISGDLQVLGTIVGNLGAASVSGNFDPALDNTYQLGNTAYRWKSIFLGPGSLHISSTTGTSGAGANYTDGILQFTSGSSLSLGTQAVGSGLAGSLELRTANTARLFVSSGGNVGIGTIAPVDDFVVYTDTSPVINIEQSHPSAGTGGILRFGTNQASAVVPLAQIYAYKIFGGAATRADLRFQTAETNTIADRMTITWDGKVGIGTISPDSKLDVAGNILASASAASVGLTLNNLAENDAKFTIQATGTAGSVARLDFLGSASQVFMAIASSGNVGIGTTNPLARLHVDHDAVGEIARFEGISAGGSGGIISFYDETTVRGYMGYGGITTLFINSLGVDTMGIRSEGALQLGNGITADITIGTAGNVGIGTTTPSAQLEVAGNIIASASGVVGLVLKSTSNQDALYQLGVTTGANFVIAGSASQVFMTIASSGNVGIGVADPTAKLHISNVGGTEIKLGGGVGLGVANISQVDTGSNLFITADGGSIVLGSTLATQHIGIVAGAVQVDLVGTATAFGVCHSTSTGVDNTPLVDCNATAGADYMEMYPTTPNIEEGEIMVPNSHSFVLDIENNKVPKLVRSSRPYQEGIIGITSIASQAGDFNSIGYNINQADNPKPLALSGRVLLKVSTQNGPVRVGDRITSSDIAGVGMKATQPGMTVGTALEDLSALAPGSYRKIMVFVGAQYWAPQVATGNLQLTTPASGSWQNGTFQRLFASIVDAFESLLNITFSNGVIQTVKGMFDTVEVQNGVTTFDEDTGLPFCIKVKGGQLISIAGECGTPTAPAGGATPTPMPSASATPLVSLDITPAPTATSSAIFTPTPTPTPSDTPPPSPISSASEGLTPTPTAEAATPTPTP